MDGIFGGITPNGKIHVELFLSRNVIPQTVKYKVEDGILKEEIGRKEKPGKISKILEKNCMLDYKV